MEDVNKVIDIPESVSYLVTPNNVANNVKELNCLFYFETPSNPALPLSFLMPRYNHPVVSYYVSRVLSSFPTETIIFYLPQLVQALRYDNKQILFHYLENAAKSSPLLAHQLLWATNSFTISSSDENKSENNLTGVILEDEKEKAYLNKLKLLNTKILNNFTNEQANKWGEENSFFEKVAAISGTLQPFLGQEDKLRKMLLEELEKVNVKGHLYLPTNNDTRVFGIELNSAAPMKSAAKVPIFVNFFVNKEHYEEQASTLEKDNNHLKDLQKIQFNLKDPLFLFPGSIDLREQIAQTHLKNSDDLLSQKETLSTESQTKPEHDNLVIEQNSLHPEEKIENPIKTNLKQACIFKVGDDVRQDMLALQIISFFKKIYQKLNLDVFLFPYRYIDYFYSKFFFFHSFVG